MKENKNDLVLYNWSKFSAYIKFIYKNTSGFAKSEDHMSNQCLST